MDKASYQKQATMKHNQNKAASKQAKLKKWLNVQPN
jgi:hypothetical protein